MDGVPPDQLFNILIGVNGTVSVALCSRICTDHLSMSLIKAWRSFHFEDVNPCLAFIVMINRCSVGFKQIGCPVLMQFHHGKDLLKDSIHIDEDKGR